MRRICITLAAISFSGSTTLAAIDQGTWDAVARAHLANKNGLGFSLTFQHLNAIISVSAETVTAQVDNTKLETLPQRVEERIFTGINCGDTELSFPKNETITTTRSVTIESSETFSASNTINGGLSFGIDAIKLNANLTQANTYSLLNRNTQTFSETITETLQDTNRKIPPKSRVYLKVTVTKGLIKAPYTGLVTFDAYANATVCCFMGPGTSDIFLHQYAPQPKDRTTPISGYIISEGYEKMDVVYLKPEKLTGNEPICKDPHFNSSTESILLPGFSPLESQPE